MPYQFKIQQNTGDTNPVNIYAGTPSKIVAKGVVLPYFLEIQDDWSSVYVESSLFCGAGSWIVLPTKPTTTYPIVPIVWTTKSILLPTTLATTVQTFTTATPITTIAPVYLSLLDGACEKYGRRIYFTASGTGYEETFAFIKILNSTIIGSETTIYDQKISSYSLDPANGQYSVLLPNGFFTFILRNTRTGAIYSTGRYKVECIATTTTTTEPTTTNNARTVSVYLSRLTNYGQLVTFDVRLNAGSSFNNERNIDIVGNLIIFSQGQSKMTPFSTRIVIGQTSATVSVQMTFPSDSVSSYCIKNIYITPSPDPNITYQNSSACI